MKKWFKWQITIKKSIIKAEKSEIIIERIIKMQKMIENNVENNVENKASSEIIIINNIFI